MNIPTEEDCIALLKDNGTPDNIIEHCMAVSRYAVSLAKKLQAKEIPANAELVRAAASLHDIEKLKPNHIGAGHDLLVKSGYPKVAEVMKKHGLENLSDKSFQPITIEEKIVFYADKRILGTQTVSLKDRFDYIRKKYNSKAIDAELMFSKKIGEEIASLIGEEP